MPAAVTCTHCGARMRTAVRLPDGRVVKCPGCGANFTAGPGNQADVPAPAAKAPPKAPAFEVVEEVVDVEVVEDEPAPKAREAAARAADDEARPRKKARPAGPDDEDDDRPRRPRRARADEDEDDRPGRTSGRGRVYWWVGGGLAAALLVGAGLFFVLRKPSGPGGEVAKALESRPKRDLPKEMFVYWPGDPYSLEYADLAAPDAGSGFLPEGAKLLGITLDQLGRRLHCSSRSATGEKVEVYGLKSAFDLPAAARANGFEAVKVTGGTIFRTARWQVFQPAPTVVVACDQGFGRSDVKDPPTKQTEELMRRGPGDTKIPDGLWELLQEVSGFPSLGGSIPRSGDDFIPVVAKFHVSGSGRVAGGAEYESLSCDSYASPEDAKRAEAGRRRLQEELAKKFPERKDQLKDERAWVDGNRLYRYSKRPAAPDPKPAAGKPADPAPAGLSAAEHAKKLQELGVPAPRDVPKVLLTYALFEEGSLTYTDCSAHRAAGRKPLVPNADVLAEVGLPEAAVDRVTRFSEPLSAANTNSVTTYLLGADYSLAKTPEKNPKGGGNLVQRQTADGKTTYLVRAAGTTAVLFQPDPRTVVAVSRYLGQGAPDPKLVARVAALTPDTAAPPDNLSAALRDVSGFPTGTLYHRNMFGLTGSARTRYEATGTDGAPNGTLTYKVEPYATAAAAAAAAERLKNEKPRPDTVQAAWAHGNAVYVYTRAAKNP